VKDEELELWRRQWNSQPAVPLELIRRVERQTVYMQLAWILHVLPALIGIATIAGAAITRELSWILLAIGTWVFLAISWRFMIENRRGVWAPTAETTAAYLDLSIERCRRRLEQIRFSNVMAVLLTIFVLVADYAILKGEGAMNTPQDRLAVIGAFSGVIFVVGIILAFQWWKRKKTQAELAYLLNLQRELGA
jgi:hypothetical protein